MLEREYDIVIIGGGIVGLATAMELLTRYPALKLVILEKEHELAQHQTGHNSGVIHSGIYYAPGSLKARLCIGGTALLRVYCDEHGIAHPETGKLIVAVRESELGRLEALKQRGEANGLRGLQMVDADGIRQFEPAARGLRAIFSPATAIVDYGQ